jgi:hypothetical protein
MIDLPIASGPEASSFRGLDGDSLASWGPPVTSLAFRERSLRVSKRAPRSSLHTPPVFVSRFYLRASHNYDSQATLPVSRRIPTEMNPSPCTSTTAGTTSPVASFTARMIL